MGTAAIARLLLLAALATAPGESAPTSPDSLPAPIATRQTYFAIPFRMEEHKPGAPGPLSLHLYVSIDQGANWRLYSSVEPNKGNFLFRAGGDGEFWLAICTMDAAGQIHPQRIERPGMRVVVDTTPPRLQLDVQRGSAGQAVARLRAVDLNLKPETIVLEYRTDANQPWQPVAVDPRNLRSSGNLCTGDVTWWMPSGAEGAEIRAKIADLAGNSTVSNAMVGAPGDSTNPPKPIPNENPLMAASSRPNPGLTGATGGGPQAFYPSERAKMVPAMPSVATNSPEASTPNRNWQTAEPAPGIGNQRGPSLTGAAGENGNAINSPGETVFRSPDGTVAIQIHPAVGDRYNPPGRLASSSRLAGLPPGGLMPGEHIRMVNAQRFELEYDLESVGPSGVNRVELWGTRDGGRTWASLGVDPDKKSPFLVNVQDEGLYGFHVAVRSGAGLGGDPPKPGDRPDVWIGVDLTKPTARLLSAVQTGGDKASQLELHWQVSDWMLAARPVSLFFSENREGPWSSIALGLENTGQYSWAFDQRTPERLFLRLEVRDEAGNLGIYETPEPIYLDQRRPQVKIREVRPLEVSSP